MKKSVLAVSICLALAGGAAFAQGKKGPPDGGEVEGGSNNLSYPVIFADGVRPSSYVDLNWAAWTFADLTGLDVTSPDVCAQETNTTVPVPDNILCYYGRQRVTVDDVVSFVGDPKVWWLQERTQNRWQTFDPVHPSLTPLTVTAVDWGDLLESGALNTRNIRTEVTLLMDARTDPEFSPYIASAFDPAGTCDLETTTTGCFAAFQMSGAVPGTDQSINEIQGTDYPNENGELIDPTLVKLGYHATVYSGCARLVVQRFLTAPAAVMWDSTLGYWVGNVSTPVLDLAAYQNEYTPEVNAGGTLLYGYNWNAKTAATGSYRLTFVLDGAPRCSTLNTQFTEDTAVINAGEVTQGVVVSKDALMTLGGDGSEGGLTYVDVTIATKGGGGGKRPR